MTFSPVLRWSANQALRSSMVEDIREEMRGEIWETRDMLIERLDHMVTVMERLLAIMEKLAATADGMKSITSTILSADVLTNEQLGQLITAIGAAAQQMPAPPQLPPTPTTNSFGGSRGPRW